jgi:hypothetical protein
MATMMSGRENAANFSCDVPVLLNNVVVDFGTKGGLGIGDSSYQLELQAEVGSDVKGVRRLWSMGGSIAMPLRHYVVMGTTNIIVSGADTRSYPAALVVYLDRANTIDSQPRPPRGANRASRGRRGGPAEAEESPFSERGRGNAPNEAESPFGGR